MTVDPKDPLKEATIGKTFHERESDERVAAVGFRGHVKPKLLGGMGDIAASLVLVIRGFNWCSGLSK